MLQHLVTEIFVDSILPVEARLPRLGRVRISMIMMMRMMISNDDNDDEDDNGVQYWIIIMVAMCNSDQRNHVPIHSIDKR